MSTNPPDPASPAPAMVDPSGQEAPAPDSVGVPIGQEATTTTGGSDQELTPTRDITSTDAGTGTEVSVTDAPAAGRVAPEVVSSPPAADQAAELPAWAANETADPSVVRAITRGTAPERPEDTAPTVASLTDSEAVADGDFVYVSPNDPKFGANVGSWLEGQVARDARLGPLLERLALLDGVYLRFPSDSPVLAVEEPADEPAAAPQPTEVPVPA